jgi:hypothetical protein
MATYTEIQQILGDASFRERVGIAMLDIAQDFISDHPTSTADQCKWAMRLIRRPDELVTTCIHQMVLTNASLTQAQILGVNDSSLKSHVLTSIAALIAAENKAAT